MRYKRPRAIEATTTTWLSITNTEKESRKQFDGSDKNHTSKAHTSINIGLQTNCTTRNPLYKMIKSLVQKTNRLSRIASKHNRIQDAHQNKRLVEEGRIYMRLSRKCIHWFRNMPVTGIEHTRASEQARCRERVRMHIKARDLSRKDIHYVKTRELLRKGKQVRQNTRVVGKRQTSGASNVPSSRGGANTFLSITYIPAKMWWWRGSSKLVNGCRQDKRGFS